MSASRRVIPGSALRMTGDGRVIIEDSEVLHATRRQDEEGAVIEIEINSGCGVGIEINAAGCG